MIMNNYMKIKTLEQSTLMRRDRLLVPLNLQSVFIQFFRVVKTTFPNDVRALEDFFIFANNRFVIQNKFHRRFGIIRKCS